MIQSLRWSRITFILYAKICLKVEEKNELWIDLGGFQLLKVTYIYIYAKLLYFIFNVEP